MAPRPGSTKIKTIHGAFATRSYIETMDQKGWDLVNQNRATHGGNVLTFRYREPTEVEVPAGSAIARAYQRSLDQKA